MFNSAKREESVGEKSSAGFSFLYNQQKLGRTFLLTHLPLIEVDCSGDWANP